MRLILLSFLLFVFSCKSTQVVKEVKVKQSRDLSLNTICQVQNTKGQTFGEALKGHLAQVTFRDEQQLYNYIQNTLFSDQESWLYKEFLKDEQFMNDWEAIAKHLDILKETEAENWLKTLQRENPACFQLMMISMDILPSPNDK